MKENLQFFLCLNDKINVKPVFDVSISYKERTRSQLQIQLGSLEEIVKHASNVDAETLPVVVCGEDFFQGGEICTASEKRKAKGQCLDRTIAYNFIAKELKELSAQYPNVLIIPGSMYVNVWHKYDVTMYKQEEGKRNGGLYVQNIAPILYSGELIRLLKKGDFLKDLKDRKSLESSTEHLSAIKEKHTISVPYYREDALADINKKLIFMGKTALPGEKQVLNSLNLATPQLTQSVFEVEGIRFGMEICGDHSRLTLKDQESLDVHIISSCGIGYIYNACGDHGYRVQADAESERLSDVSLHENYQYPLTTIPSQRANEKFFYCSSRLPVLRYQSDLSNESENTLGM